MEGDDGLVLNPCEATARRRASNNESVIDMGLLPVSESAGYCLCLSSILDSPAQFSISTCRLAAQVVSARSALEVVGP